MNKLIETIKDAVSSFFVQMQYLTVKDILDIIFVAVVIYMAVRFIRDRRAGKLILGVVVLSFGKIVCDVFELSTMSYLLRMIFENGLLALVIVFQPELRSLLELVGGESLRGLKTSIIGNEQKEIAATTELVEAICVAVCDMSKEKTGALIVIERETKLGEIANSGVKIDSYPSQHLIKNIFFKNSPLHDGAMLIRGNRLDSAGCFLPLSNNADIIRDLGTRHRAAIGMSENSDALVIVVSEETGNISITSNGKITRNYDYTTLRNQLTAILVEPMKVKKKSDKTKKHKNGH